MRTAKYVGLLLAITQLYTLLACANQTGTPLSFPLAKSAAVPDQEPVTLTLQTIQSDKNSPAYKIEEKIVRLYTESHPGIKIEFDRLNTEQQKLKLKTQAASDEVDDITMVNPGAQMKPFVDSGVLAPLNDILEGDLEKTFQNGVLNYYTFNKKVYALPYSLNIAGFFYNKDLFNQAGLTVPKTFEELTEVCGQLKAKGVTPIVIGAKERWPVSFLFMNIVQRLNGGPGFLQDVIDGRRTFNDPVFVGALQKLQDLIQAGAFGVGATSVDSLSASSLFRSGKGAMYYIGTWELSKIELSPLKGRVGFVQFPTVEGKGSRNDFMIAPGTAYALNARSKHLKESKDFLKYLMTNYMPVAFQMNAAVGLSQKVEGDFLAAGYSQLQLDTLHLFQNINGGDMNFDNMIVPAVTQTHLDQLQSMLVQRIRPEDVAKDLELSWETNARRK